MMIGLLLASWSVASCNVRLALLQRPTDTLRLYAVGDINLGRRVSKQRLLEGDTLYPFRALLDTLRGRISPSAIWRARSRPTAARCPTPWACSPRRPPPRRRWRARGSTS